MNWPPLEAPGSIAATTGTHKALFRIAQSRNGDRQVIYAGHPLYTFAGDKRPGETNGEGIDKFGGEWYAVAPNGRSIEPHAATTIVAAATAARPHEEDTGS